jgi:hypothetical protein
MDNSAESNQLKSIESTRVSGLDDHVANSGPGAPARKTVIQLKEGIEVSPMYEENGRSNLSKEVLGQVFRRIVREESVYKIFYDGSVRNTRDFRKFMRNPDNEIFLVSFNGKEAGFFWLNHFRQKSFFINYCLYREFWGETALTISTICIGHIFKRTNSDGEFLVDVLLGLTPANNKLAVNFLLKNDMTILGKVPGFLYDSIEDETVDGIFSYRQRDNKKSGFKMPSIFFM